MKGDRVMFSACDVAACQGLSQLRPAQYPADFPMRSLTPRLCFCYIALRDRLVIFHIRACPDQT